MVSNCYIECQVCHSITRIRLQVGYLDGHPIVVTCGKCGISLSGKVIMDQENIGLNFSFDNADIVGKTDKEDFIVECSGEFPVRKNQSAIDLITPFLKNQMRMGPERYEKFNAAIQTLNWSEKHWIDFKRIIDLSRNGNKQYLLPEIWKVMPKEMFPCRDEFETFRAIHVLELRHFASALREEIVQDMEFSAPLLAMDTDQLIALIGFLNDHEGFSLSDMQKSIYKVYEEFQEVSLNSSMIRDS